MNDPIKSLSDAQGLPTLWTSIRLFLLLSLLWPWVSSAQTIDTFAGNGVCGSSGDGGPATLASFCAQDDVDLDAAGNLYIADANVGTIRRVDVATGIISTVAGNGVLGFSGDGGPAVLASFNYPTGIAFDLAGNMYVSDFDNCVIRRVDAATGVITTVAGGGPTACGFSGDGGPGSAAQLNRPIRITHHNGALYIADYQNNRIRRWDIATGIITTVVGTGTPGFSGDGGPATAADLEAPEGITFDSAGNLFFTDTGNYVVRRVDALSGIITTFAGTPGVAGYSGDGGPATSATFSTEPDDIQEGCNGNIFVSDDFNHVIRMVNISTGIITTIAGSGVQGYSGDGGPALASRMDHPEALVLNAAGDLLFSDYGNSRVRVVSLVCNPTATPTLTQSPTPTFTPTFTLTLSFTPTPTLSPTPSLSTTPTNSPTPTYSPTPSPSPTFTFTSSPTSTPTLSIIFDKTTAKRAARSGDVFTYDLRFLLPQGQALDLVVLDLLPPELTFLDLLPGSLGIAAYDPTLHRLTWTLPTPLPPGAYQLGYQVRMKDFVEGGTLMINQAALTSSSLPSPMDRAATVLAESPLIVRAGVYNEAGELVETLFIRSYSQAVYDLDLSAGSIGSLRGPDRKVDLFSNGAYLGTWEGLNREGDPVTNGVYHIKFDIQDVYGSVSTITRQVTVERRLARVDVSIFNGAGEVVRRLQALVDDANTTRLSGVHLDKRIVRVGLGEASSDALQVLLATTGEPVTLWWDGKNDLGREVSAGHYQVETLWDDGTGGIKTVSLGVVVQDDGRPIGTLVRAVPNLLSTANGFTSVISLSPPQGATLSVGIHTVAGELAASLEGPPGGDTVAWDASGLSSGLYFVRVGIHGPDGKLQGHRILKIAVLR